MKKSLLIMLLFVVIIGNLVACSVSETPEKDGPNERVELQDKRNVKRLDAQQLANLPADLKRLHEKEKLEVAIYSEDRFPYFFLDGKGKLVGNDIEMAYDIAFQLGIDQVEFNRSAKSYDEIINLVAENKVDMAISKVSITLNRAQRVLFSEPYISLKQAVLLNRVQYSTLKKNDMEIMQTILSNQVKVGVVAGTSYMEYAYKFFSPSLIMPYENKDKLIEAVKSGEIMAAFYDEFEFKQVLKEQPDILISLQLAVFEENKDHIAIALPAESKQMQEWLKYYFSNRLPVDMDDVLNQYGDAYE